jgi:2-oxoglutarate ferredoxin oxidoreductase subunit gamma
MSLTTPGGTPKLVPVEPDPRHDVILTGIGGQGIQLCAKVLALAAAADDHHVMLSSYFGGEMRGGRTEATVVTRDQPIVGLPPIVPRLNAAIVLHPEFLGDALPRLSEEPLVVADAWAWPDDALTGGRVVRVPARERATDLGAPVAAGLVLVGTFAALTGTARPESLAGAVRELVPAHRVAALEADLAAVSAGHDFATTSTVSP